jgi:hypothetical protein
MLKDAGRRNFDVTLGNEKAEPRRRGSAIFFVPPA